MLKILTSCRLPENPPKHCFRVCCLVCAAFLAGEFTYCSTLDDAQRVDTVSDVPDEGYKITVPVDLVVLPVTVLDRKGRFVSGLTRENFKIYEDGKPQKIRLFLHEDIPVTVGLVLDNSGSMFPKLPEVNAAALAFAQFSNSQDEMFVVKFNERVSLGLPAEVPFTNNEDQLKAALLRNTPRGRTALYDAIIAALQHGEKGTRSKRVLLVVSDGGDNSSKHDFAQVLEQAKKSNAIIYVIGLYDVLDPERNPKALRRLAKLTGGEAFLPDKVERVRSICQYIARAIRDQYTLEYLPSDQNRDGSYRTVRVTVDSPSHEKLIVLTRAGYYEPQENSSSYSGEE